MSSCFSYCYIKSNLLSAYRQFSFIYIYLIYQICISVCAHTLMMMHGETLLMHACTGVHINGIISLDL